MGELNINEYQRVVSAIFSAVLDDSQAPALLETLSEAGGDAWVIMSRFDMSDLSNDGILVHGYGPDQIDSYRAHFQYVNPWARAFPRATPGVPITSEEVCPRDMLLRTEFYNDFLRPAGDIAAGGGVLFGRDGNRLSVLGGNVRLRDEERLLPRWMEIVRLIAPHLEAGFAIRRRIEGTTLSALASTGLGPKGPVALLALDRKRRCLFANRSARRMMERGEPLGIDPSGRVRGATPDTNLALMQSCARLAAEDGRMAERVALEDRGGRRTHAAEVMHFDPRHFRENPFGSFFGFDRPCQVLVLPEAEETGPTARERFAARHGLTVREAEIAEGVADGLTPAELALRDGVSPHTVRNQVKSVLSKSGLRRQTELAALFERERRIGEDPA